MSTQTQTKPTSARPHDEQILVVKRELIVPDPGWHGIVPIDVDATINLITTHQQYLSRSVAETDPVYKQIIPYLVFTHNDRYFLMQRRSTASETRLRNKFSLGIGGHMRQEDLADATTIFDWARREFAEEIAYDGSLTIEPIGLLNDDTNEVGKVHIGLVLLLRGSSAQITVKSELKSGELVDAATCRAQYDNLEQWSQLVLDHLTTSRSLFKKKFF